MRPWLESFLLEHPVFHIQGLENLLAQRKGLGEDVPTLRGLINHLRKKAQIEGMRQQVFRSLVSQPDAPTPDPYLIASQLEPSVVLSHRAALHWHLGWPAPDRVHFLSRQIAHPWAFDGRIYVPVQDRLPEVATKTFTLGNCLIQVTSAERTLVDLLNRPDLETDRLKTWRDLQCLRITDESLLQSYLERLANRTLNAKVGYFLDTLPEGHHLRSRCLDHFGGSKLLLPNYPVPWDQQQAAPTWEWNERAVLRPRWSLLIPEALADLEPPPAGDPAETGDRTPFDLEEISSEFLEADLWHTFQFKNYREGQEGLVWKVLNGEDAFGILPTGSGKSLTYLQPSTLLSGPTIVISPLIALIDDQIQEARAFGLNAFALDRSSRKEALSQVLDLLRSGKLHLIFIPPESWTWLFRTVPRLRTLTRQIVVDEAHVVVEWGQDFRKAYRHLGRIREQCPAPILALTATATLRTQGEIIRELKLVGIKPKRRSVRKENLTLHVERTGLPDGRAIPRHLRKLPKPALSELREAIYQSRLNILKPYLAARLATRGIIYCERKLDADLLAKELQGSSSGRVEVYHGDLSRVQRKERLLAFKKGKVQIMVATVAFGLGVNIDDIGFVVHFGMPTSLDAYTQAIGRAGRDNSPSDCLLIYVDGEEAFAIWRASHSPGGRSPLIRLKRRRKGQIQAVVEWLQESTCRHVSLDEYFGIESGPVCGTRCDTCIERSEPLPRPQPKAVEVLKATEPDPWGTTWDFTYDVDLDSLENDDD